ncbi:M48 family metallopeptidase [Lentibacter sp. XHP0401]|uniref:M48 family metallopeptidase n=1 Tax=Lentibacter sp. XHP0401 TaxID=2984334 RepID=UPI0021E88919|nr:SprT family zinc-dependent metalloprotease [Lentibacter sp. XHP0401]MCV2894747.1 M48 family metallopeptidase [Lentibacter sp. XHP0401]
MNTEVSQIGGLEVEIVRKKIKNLHIGCYPPEGRVRVAAPELVTTDAIRLAVLTRIPWIKRKQAQFLQQERQSPRRYVSGETHFLFGRPLRLEVQVWGKKVHRVSRRSGERLLLNVPMNSNADQLHRWMNAWYKAELRKLVAPRIETWAMRMGVQPEKWGIRSMKTKWGSCNPNKGIVWLNAELAKKPEKMIDYVIVHELAHFVSSRHDELFTSVLDREMPSWRQLQRELNALPLAAWEAHD